MFKISNSNVTRIDKTTFSNFNYRESDIEELLRKNIDMICDEEESMLIVGKQVRNANHGISDLTAIDHEGNIVLIEIKEIGKISRVAKKRLNSKQSVMQQVIQRLRMWKTWSIKSTLPI